MTLKEIEKGAKAFADARIILRGCVETLEDELLTAKKRYLPTIRKAVEAAKEREAALKAAIEQAPDLFQKPKTLTLFGIRIGFMKQKGKIEWDDDDLVIRLLKKCYPETWETYVKITQKPIRAALETLPASDLKKIGVEATDSGEAVVIKPVDSEVDKLVDALLKENHED